MFSLLNMNFTERLNLAFERAKISKTALWKHCGVSSGLVTQWLDGTVKKLSGENLLKVAKLLNVSPEWLLTGKGRFSNTAPGPDIRNYVPLISEVQAGEWSEAIDPHEPGYAEDWLPCPKKNGHHTYALRVRGDSMTAPFGKSYPEGCIIFVDPDKRSPANGERIIAKLKGSNEVTFKAFQRDAGRVWLKPLNPQHPPVMEPFTVLGTVIGKWEDE